MIPLFQFGQGPGRRGGEELVEPLVGIQDHCKLQEAISCWH
jgi:hypothetical protein